MESFWAWFRWVHDATGVNLTIFYDRFDRVRFASGLLMTVELSAVCILLSVAIGIAGAWLQRSRLRFTRNVVHWYIQFFRNTPPLCFSSDWKIPSAIRAVSNGIGLFQVNKVESRRRVRTNSNSAANDASTPQVRPSVAPTSARGS